MCISFNSSTMLKIWISQSQMIWCYIPQEEIAVESHWMGPNRTFELDLIVQANMVFWTNFYQIPLNPLKKSYKVPLNPVEKTHWVQLKRFVRSHWAWFSLIESNLVQLARLAEWDWSGVSSYDTHPGVLLKGKTARRKKY